MHRLPRRTRKADPGPATGGTYRIRIAGVLGEEWSGRAYGMIVSVHRSEGEGSFTELTGELPDQAALLGVLDRLYTHGAKLLKIEFIPSEDRTSGGENGPR